MKGYVISVSLCTGCYRHIQIAASATLYRLHKAILDAFEFEDDHMHAFFMDNHLWSPECMYSSDASEPGERLTRSYKLSQFHLQKGDKFRYVFDFGDSWEFQCKLLRETEEATKTPIVLRSVGESPEQYPDWDEEIPEAEAEDEAPWITEEEANELYRLIPLKKTVILTLKDYFRASARLYGIISLDKLREIYNSQNSPIDEMLFFCVAKVFSMQEDIFCIIQPEGQGAADPKQPEVVHVALLYDDAGKDLQKMQQLQKGKEFYIPPKAEFLRYADEEYFPLTPANTKLKQYLLKHLPPDEAEMSWHAIQGMISMDCELSDMLESLEAYTSFFQKPFDFMELSALYQEVNNTTRMMANRGYTPHEMAAKLPKAKRQQQAIPLGGQLSLTPEAEAPIKVLSFPPPASRNAPCPCGSGLKYKHCCGKKK